MQGGADCAVVKIVGVVVEIVGQLPGLGHLSLRLGEQASWGPSPEGSFLRTKPRGRGLGQRFVQGGVSVAALLCASQATDSPQAHVGGALL